MFAKIFAKLFGETEELEIQNLEKKVILTAVGLACCLIGLLLLLVKLNSVGEIVYGIGGIALFVALFMWGFGAIKKLFGIGTIGAIFSGNVVFGVVIFFTVYDGGVSHQHFCCLHWNRAVYLSESEEVTGKGIKVCQCLALPGKTLTTQKWARRIWWTIQAGDGS